ncbi:hypothetical protein AAII07_26875 [Microvirga sp. 0TCS3.31]|jgi:hypothetical protein
MPDKKRLHLCGCIGLAVVSFGLIVAIVAQPLLSDVWSPAIATAQLSR